MKQQRKKKEKKNQLNIYQHSFTLMTFPLRSCHANQVIAVCIVFVMPALQSQLDAAIWQFCKFHFTLSQSVAVVWPSCRFAVYIAYI